MDHLTGGWPHHAENGFSQRGLASAGFAHQPQDLPPVNVKGHIVDHLMKALAAQYAALPVPGGYAAEGKYQFVRHGCASFRFRVGMASMSFFV